MKYFLCTLLLLLNCLVAFEQDQDTRMILETKRKFFPVYYAELNNTTAYVYDMEKYLEKGGSGPGIRKTDTLFKQTDGSYAGNNIKITKENDQFYLTTVSKKSRTYSLYFTADLKLSNHELNHGYYLNRFFAMCDDLNKKYPLSNYSFRNGFYTWKTLPNQDLPHEQFRKFADEALQQLRDSVSGRNDRFIALTNSIVQNLATLDYEDLKNSLPQLPTEYPNHAYFDKIITEVASHKPEYFWRLAEDLPELRDAIFLSVKFKKRIVNNVKTIPGYDEIKKQFFGNK